MNFIKKVWYTLLDVSNHPLKRQRRLMSAFEFAYIQTAARMVPGDLVVEFPNRTRLMVSPKMKGAAHFIYPGLCEFSEMAFVMHFLRPGDCFVDAGSNVGDYTVLASAVAGADSIAIEPNPHVYRYLADNVVINNVGSKVSAVNVALGRENGNLRFTENLGTENHVCADDYTGSSVMVAVTTLDDLTATRKPTMLKIDVEGFETEVMAGAGRMLTEASLQVIQIERIGNSDRYGFNDDELHEKIRKNGFTPCAYYPMTRKLVKIENSAQGNILYVRDLQAVQERVQKGAAFSFGGQTI